MLGLALYTPKKLLCPHPFMYRARYIMSDLSNPPLDFLVYLWNFKLLLFQQHFRMLNLAAAATATQLPHVQFVTL